MAGILPGRYGIQLVAGPHPFVGENSDRPFVEPIVTNAKYKTWGVQEVPEGGYILILSEPAALFSNADNRKLVGDLNPPAIVWNIVREDNGFRIQLPGPSLPPAVWTVANPGDPSSPVILEYLQDQAPHLNQLWNFVPVNE